MERRIKFFKRFAVFALAERYVIELVFHLGGEGVADILHEVIFQKSAHNFAGIGGFERATNFFHIPALFDCPHY